MEITFFAIFSYNFRSLTMTYNQKTGADRDDQKLSKYDASALLQTASKLKSCISCVFAVFFHHEVCFLFTQFLLILKSKGFKYDFFSNFSYLGVVIGKLYIRIISFNNSFFTRSQFWPKGIVVACVCLCACPSVHVCGNHLLVHAINHHPLNLRSPNLDHRCKRPWLRSLLY